MLNYDNMSYEDKIKYNKQLVNKYPFLYPRYAWSGEKIEDYDYSFTELDDLPTGWRISFGDLICEDIKNELIKFNYLDKYQIVQIKEKFGALRWYDNGTPVGCQVENIIEAYSHLSENICIICGKPKVPVIDDNWICPYCENCYVNKYNYNWIEDPERRKLVRENKQKFWNECKEEQSPIEFYKTMKFRRYSQDGYKDVEYDLTPYIQKIITKWESANEH